MIVRSLILSLHLSLNSAGCSIVNLGSISSFVGQAGMCTYSATKAAILALTRCTAIDCGPHGIRVNAICPGPILTEATKRHADSQVREGGWGRRAACGLTPLSLPPSPFPLGQEHGRHGFRADRTYDPAPNGSAFRSGRCRCIYGQ